MSIHVQVPGDGGGGAVEVPEGEDMAGDDEGDNDVPIPGGDTVHLMGEEVPSKSRLLREWMNDLAKVDEGDFMAKHVDNASADQVPVEEGAEVTKMFDQREVPLAREENEEEFLMANQECYIVYIYL